MVALSHYITTVVASLLTAVNALSFEMNESQNQDIKCPGFVDVFTAIRPFRSFYRWKWQISLPFHILQLVKFLPFHIPEALLGGASPYRLLYGVPPPPLLGLSSTTMQL